MLYTLALVFSIVAFLTAILGFVTARSAGRGPTGVATLGGSLLFWIVSVISTFLSVWMWVAYSLTP